MPMIQVHMIEGRAAEQKARLTQEVTQAVERVLGVSAERVHVLIHEYDSENWSIGGVPVQTRGAVS